MRNCSRGLYLSLLNFGQLKDSRTGHSLLELCTSKCVLWVLMDTAKPLTTQRVLVKIRGFCHEIQLKSMHECGKEPCKEEGGEGKRGCEDKRGQRMRVNRIDYVWT